MLRNKFHKALFFYCIALSLLVSCTSAIYVDDIRTDFKRPLKSVTILSDTTIFSIQHECLYCVDIAVASDSHILLRENDVTEDNGKFYKAYSLPDFSYKGDLLMKGRGTGEFIFPYVVEDPVSVDTEAPMAYVFDITLSQSFGVDVAASLRDGKTKVKRLPSLPYDVIYAYPYLDSLQFVMNMEQDRLWCQIIDNNGERKNSMCMFGSIPVSRSLPFLGSTTVFDRNEGRIAILMACLPQVNIINAEMTGVFGIAVNKSYRNWKRILNAMDDKTMSDPVRYYKDAVSSDGYIIGLYKGFRDSEDRHSEMHLHIFDWSGNFLYDVGICEHIGAITYDKRTGYLYGLDKSAAEIYRYDLSEIIEL